MHNGKDKSWLDRAGCAVSEWVANVMAHPFAQIAVISVCALWWLAGLPTDILTACLSIMAITLTQMVLNNQAERESDTHRRDVAMHAKLDELVAAMKDARNELVGAEELEEEEIEQLKGEVQQAIDHAGPEAGGAREREAAKRAVEKELREEARKVGSAKGRKRASR